MDGLSNLLPAEAGQAVTIFAELPRRDTKRRNYTII